MARPVFLPPIAHWPAAGVYQLRIRVRRPVVIRVGRLGRVRFVAGVYVYTGRASRGLVARVQRHARRHTTRHWHIDYLLAARWVRLEAVALVSDDPDDECRVNACMLARAIDCPVPRFGASDCRARCPAHLCRVDDAGAGDRD